MILVTACCRIQHGDKLLLITLYDIHDTWVHVYQVPGSLLLTGTRYTMIRMDEEL